MKRVTLRRYLTFVVPAMFFIVFFSLYLMMESVDVSSDIASDSVRAETDIKMETKLKLIKDDIKMNRDTLHRIKEIISDISKGADDKKWKQILKMADKQEEEMPVKPDNSSDGKLTWRKSRVQIPIETCKLAESAPPKVDIQMLDVLHQLPFDNPDGGVWKQGYPIKYDPDSWKTEKLKVFVVPHSHNDPGWIKTFDGYYNDQTRHILDNMVRKLEEYPQMRFLYAEISFFSRWWRDVDANRKEKVKRLLRENRLEIVSGGWVMTDEANAHYFAMLDQMIEGNQWLWNQVGVKPVSSWSIDPFGYSPTMAYLLHELGFKNMLIQRIHYSVKKYMAETRQLEFHWRQGWDHVGGTNMFCHMMPFYSYDIPHSCGPDPKTCCQFDFKRLVGGSFKCPWNVPPVSINDENVEKRAETLLDQYRKKSRLYKNNVVLIPLGDDFRYDKAEEWDHQYVNYKKLFDFINGKTEWNAEIQFATLTDYFKALRERAGSNENFSPAGYPVLSGDFFTYADRDDHYWSGYFTSRPFYKGLDRVLESHQRGGEIIFALALAVARRLEVNAFPANELFAKLVSARRYLGLFQHHDAIAGTAKDAVVVDYGVKLLQSIQDMKRIIIASAQFLLTVDKRKYAHRDVAIFDVDETRASHDSLPEKTVIYLKDHRQPVVFYNSLSRDRTSLVTLIVDSVHLEVRDSNDFVVKTQISPFWTTDGVISSSFYRVSFLVNIPPLGLVKYSIVSTKPNSNPSNMFAKVKIFNSPEEETSQVGPFTVEKKKSGSETEIVLETTTMKLMFTETTGMLKEVLLKESNDLIATKIEFVHYGVRQGQDQSGAYLFIPDGEAQLLQYERNPILRKIEGSLLSEMRLTISLVDHTIRIVDSSSLDSSAIDIINLVDIRTRGNFELAMRIVTGIKNMDDEYFTDLNGFQVLRRKSLKTLPLNANFYPMSTTAFLENEKHRLNILTAQSLGVSSLKAGWLEIMQDRRLNQDDHRGLNQPVHDNKVTPNVFRMLIEKRESTVSSRVKQPVAYPSLRSHLISQELLNPVHVLPPAAKNAATATSNEATSSDDHLLSELRPLRTDLPCDVHLVNLRNLQKGVDGSTIRPADDVGLILHRLGVDCGFSMTGAVCHFTDGQISLSSLFSLVQITEAYSSALNLVEHKSLLNMSSAVNIPSMEIRSYKIKLR